MQSLNETWVYLSANPLMHLTLTLVAFHIGTFLFQKSKLNPLLNPVLISIIIIVAVLSLNETPYEVYFDGAQFVHFLLGPATVALAIPLYRQFEKVRRSAIAICVSLLCGSIAAITSAVAVAWALKGSNVAMISLAPKSITAPVAMGVAEKIGGLPSLTAVLVITTGIFGAIFGQMLLKALKVTDSAAVGLAIGTASHGIGTARALQINEEAGAFSSLAMGLNAIATALLLPLAWGLIAH